MRIRKTIFWTVMFLVVSVAGFGQFEHAAVADGGPIPMCNPKNPPDTNDGPCKGKPCPCRLTEIASFVLHL